MIRSSLVIAGVGGQGVVFLSRLFTEVARLAADQVLSFESHGMAMRGGSVSSHLKIGAFHSPVIGWGEADILMLLADEELANVGHFLKQSGNLFVNGAIESAHMVDCSIRSIGATELAVKHQLPQAANLILAGFAAGHSDFPYTIEQFQQALQQMPLKEKIRAANLAALDIGFTAYTHSVIA
ncbi:MAG: 2-oxoacid:acceptor oxidoreductase family protein [Deltaproteobacteria bacterium]|nr:2-oxoacid:acceptor oxidoreductase family protein [Candidatus Anaeroferrophillus wilburensis]MBN2888841.1 2-oxoacid:acceptor oxidoreductase family protein [Deltaproteobacteria bacterium]